MSTLWTPPAEDKVLETPSQNEIPTWEPPATDIVQEDWMPPRKDDKDDPINIKDPLKISQLKKSGQQISDEQERILFDYEDEKPITQKAGEFVGAALPEIPKAFADIAIGGAELGYKGLVLPLNEMFLGFAMYTPEQRAKIIRDRDLTYKALASGGAQGLDEAMEAGTRLAILGSSITDKAQGLPKEERFRRYMARESMRKLSQAAREETPDTLARLASESPLIRKFVSTVAAMEGGTPEAQEAAVKEYEKLVKESGMTKEELDEFAKVVNFGDVKMPINIPGANTLTEAISKPIVKATQKGGEFALRGLNLGSRATGWTAEKTIGAGEFIQKKARDIGEYAVNDQDTFVKTAANTALAPVMLVAKPTKSVANVITDITRQVDVGGAAGRRGMFERAGRDVRFSELTQKLFGPEGKGGVGRAKLADWAVRQSNAMIQPGVNAGALNVLMGLPDAETAAQAGQQFGTGFGIGAYSGSRIESRAFGMVDPRTTMAQKVSNLVTPDPTQLRRDQDADIKRFMASASPEMKQQMQDLANIDKRKAAIDERIASLTDKQSRTINKEDSEFLQMQIDGFQKQKAALEKATPETQKEYDRLIQLTTLDALDQAQSVGIAAGLRGMNLVFLDPANAESFYRNLYGQTLIDAERNKAVLEGKSVLSPDEQNTMREANETLAAFAQKVNNAQNTRGFAISEPVTDANDPNYIPPHLRMQNQKGATAVISMDLVKHLTSQGFNVRHAIQHEVQHALEDFKEVQDLLSPVRKYLFDQKVQNDDGTFIVVSEGVYNDQKLDEYAMRYAQKFSPADGGAGFFAQFGGDIQKQRDYIKREILAEVATSSGDYEGGSRAALDDVGRNFVDWLEVTTKNGFLKKMKEGLRKVGVIVDNSGGYTTLFEEKISPEVLATIRQYQRGVRDLNGALTYNASREVEEPDIPLVKIVGNRALQEKYKNADFFEKEQIVKATQPNGSQTEIVIPEGANLDSFTGIYRIQNGQLVDEDGTPMQLAPEIDIQAMPEGTKFEVDTRIARHPDGSPIIIQNREMKRRAIDRTKMIVNAIESAPKDDSPFRMIDVGNGDYRGAMSPSQVEALMQIPNTILSPNLKRMIQFMNEILRRGDGTRVMMEYQAALLNGKYKSIAPRIRDEVPIGFKITKDGNFTVTTMSVSRMYDKMNAWAAKKPLNLSLWGGDTGKFWDSVLKVLDNHARGERGEVGLHPDPYISLRMKYKVNDLFNVYNAETKAANPDRTTLPREKGKDPIDVIVRSRRLDRINSYTENSAQKLPMNYGKLLENYLPENNPLARPQTPEEMMQNLDGSVTATRIRNAIASGNVEQLESELRASDDLLPFESLYVSQGETGEPQIQVISMLEPGIEPSLEPSEIPRDIDAETEAEIARLDAEQDMAEKAQKDQLDAQQAKKDQLASRVRAEFIPPAADEIVDSGISYLPAEDQFYSRLQRGIEESQQATYSPDQAKALARKSTNAEELKWSGIENAIDFIAEENNGKVPKQALLDYMANEGQVQFEEVILAENAPESYDLIKKEKELDALLIKDDLNDEEKQRIRELRFALRQTPIPQKPKYGPSGMNKVIPGGENYREIVLTMPEKKIVKKESLPSFQIAKKDNAEIIKTFNTANEAYDFYSNLENKLDYEIQPFPKPPPPENYNYISSHYQNIPNYVAHIRLNERKDAEGKEGLFIEEIQSDRHQRGRKYGYDSDIPKFDPAKLKVEKAPAGGYTAFNVYYDGVLVAQPPSFAAKNENDAARIGRESVERGLTLNRQGKTPIPDAPFRKDWPLQMFKRALRDAVASGKEWIGWTDGETQADRYDLSQQVDEVRATKDDEGTFVVRVFKNGKEILGRGQLDQSGVADLVGKELAEKIAKEAKVTNPGQTTWDGWVKYEGQDLKVGGEGMKGFYDNMLPKEIGRYVDKMGGKVEKSSIQTGAIIGDTSRMTPADAERALRYAEKTEKEGVPIWRVNITPEMAAIVSKGQPQYLPAEYSDEYGLERGQEAETRLTPRTLYNLYYIATEPEPTSEYGREISNEYIDKYKRLYVDVFSNLVRQQIEKYIGRGRVDSNVTKKALDKADTPEMLDELMRGTYRSDMRRRNDVWNIVTDHLKNLASAKTKKDKIFYMDRLNNSIHNTQELLFSKFSNYRQLQEAFDSIHNARDTRAYAQRVDKDLRESNSFNSDTAYLPYVEYELPKDPRKIMADFYLLTSVGDKAGYFGKDWEKIKDGQMPTRTGLRYEEYGQNLEDAVGKLTEQMKGHMIDSLMFSISAELRHALGRNQPDELMDNPFMKAYKEYYDSYEKLKSVNLTPLIEKNLQGIYPEGKRARITKGSPESYQTSNKAVRKALEETNTSLKDFSEITENLFRKGKWSPSYGGQPWGNIAAGLRMIIDANTTSDMVKAMDNAYDLQHNTATVFNKIKKYQREGGYKWLQDMLDFKYHAVTPRELIPLSSSAAKRIATPALIDIGDPAIDKSRENAVAASSEELVSGVEAAIARLKENQENVYNDIWVKAQKGSGKDINEELFKWLRSQMPARKDELEAVGVNQDLIRYARLLLAEKMAPEIEVPSDIKEMVARSIKEQKQRANPALTFLSLEDKNALMSIALKNTPSSDPQYQKVMRGIYEKYTSKQVESIFEWYLKYKNQVGGLLAKPLENIPAPYTAKAEKTSLADLPEYKKEPDFPFPYEPKLIQALKELILDPNTGEFTPNKFQKQVSQMAKNGAFAFDDVQKVMDWGEEWEKWAYTATESELKQEEKTPDIEEFWPKALSFMSLSEIEYIKQTIKDSLEAGKNYNDWIDGLEIYGQKAEILYSPDSQKELKNLFDTAAKKFHKSLNKLSINKAEDYFQNAINNSANYGWKEIVDINADWPEQLVDALFQYGQTKSGETEFLSLPQTISIGERTYTAYTPNKNGDIFILYGDYNNSGEDMNYNWTGAAQFKTVNKTAEEIISDLSEWLKGEVDNQDPQI